MQKYESPLTDLTKEASVDSAVSNAAADTREKLYHIIASGKMSIFRGVDLQGRRGGGIHFYNSTLGNNLDMMNLNCSQHPKTQGINPGCLVQDRETKENVYIKSIPYKAVDSRYLASDAISIIYFTKILYYMGYGMDATFCREGDDKGVLQISKDLGFSRREGQRSFWTFRELREEEESGGKKISEKEKKEISLLIEIGNLFLLSDFNEGNYGLVIKEGKPFGGKIVDFVAPSIRFIKDNLYKEFPLSFDIEIKLDSWRLKISKAGTGLSVSERREGGKNGDFNNIRQVSFMEALKDIAKVHHVSINRDQVLKLWNIAEFSTNLKEEMEIEKKIYAPINILYEEKQILQREMDKMTGEKDREIYDSIDKASCNPYFLDAIRDLMVMNKYAEMAQRNIKVEAIGR